MTPTQTAESTTPSELPPPGEGYRWHVTPANGAFDYGLPLYAVQVPTEYIRTPAGPYYGNPEEFVPGAVSRFSTRIVIRITPADAVILYGFQNELPWQGGGLCGILPAEGVASALGTWSVYEFKCPETETGICAADEEKTMITCASQDSSVPLAVFDGLAAEMRAGNFVYSILVFQPTARTDAEAAFHDAIRSFRPL